jgi:hypothetical protein
MVRINKSSCCKTPYFNYNYDVSPVVEFHYGAVFAILGLNVICGKCRKSLLSSICNFCIFFFYFDAQILKIHLLYFPTAGAYISNLYTIFSNKKEII